MPPSSTSTIYVKGLEQVLHNLHVAVEAMEEITKEGLVAGGLFIQGEAQRRCPVDTGNLKASAFTVWGDSLPPTPTFSGKSGPGMTTEHTAKTNASNISCQEAKAMGYIMVNVGFTAFYAIYVHEDTTASHLKRIKASKAKKVASIDLGKGKFLGNIGQAKFLEAALLENMQNVLDIIAGKTTASDLRKAMREKGMI
jgi:hypothetical protein